MSFLPVPSVYSFCDFVPFYWTSHFAEISIASLHNFQLCRCVLLQLPQSRCSNSFYQSANARKWQHRERGSFIGCYINSPIQKSPVRCPYKIIYPLLSLSTAETKFTNRPVRPAGGEMAARARRRGTSVTHDPLRHFETIRMHSKIKWSDLRTGGINANFKNKHRARWKTLRVIVII